MKQIDGNNKRKDETANSSQCRAHLESLSSCVVVLLSCSDMNSDSPGVWCATAFLIWQSHNILQRYMGLCPSRAIKIACAVTGLRNFRNHKGLIVTFSVSPIFCICFIGALHSVFVKCLINRN